MKNKKSVLTADHLAAADELIDKMDLMQAATDEDGEPCEALKPKFTFNPVLQHFLQVVLTAHIHFLYILVCSCTCIASDCTFTCIGFYYCKVLASMLRFLLTCC